jgi:pSer/pThr/pTyr-binding forkhead associated (FHA) protein
MSDTDGDEVVEVAGHPRLVVATDGHAVAGSSEASGVQREFVLDRELTTIGSGDDQDVQVPGLEPAHGEIRRDATENDYVYTQVGDRGFSRVDGSRVRVSSLHHGDRLELGDVTLVFQRDEFADHGRLSKGGREGGQYRDHGTLGSGTHKRPH